MAQDVTLGIDIGGTNTAFGFVDLDGRCVAEASIPTRGEELAESLVARVAARARDMLVSLGAGFTLRGAGIGAPNGNYYKGTADAPPNLGWQGSTPLAAMFGERLGVRVTVTNDANAAALGEMLFGAARGMRDFIAITLGTGLGSGIVCNGQLVHGFNGFAGELGHTQVDPGGRECGCGRRGCLETYASATGLCRTVFELLAVMRAASELRSIPFDRLTASDVSAAAARGDLVARAAFEFTGRTLGRKLADSVAHTGPEAIILLGGLARAGELLFDPTREALDANLTAVYEGSVRLLPSGLPAGNAGVVGAAALSWTELGVATR
jgi:glucokinase